MIEVKNLTKRYGKHVAINNISFTVNDGEIIGFLGPNGAGKTTTMNIMTGYISSTEGEVIINGHSILDEPLKAKANIGYLPDSPPVYGEMRVDEYLKFVANIKKVKPSARKKMIEDVKEKVKITEMSNRLIKNLSKGYRQRVGLAQAMLGNPKVLILDEPTVGLDPKQIIEMRQVIKDLGKEHTIILSSHILSEVSAVCDRVMIISKGSILASDTPENLSNSINKNNKLIVRIKDKDNYSKQYLENIFTKCPKITNAIFQGSKEEDTWDFILEGETETDIREDVYKTSAENGLTLLMMKSLELTLEEIFLKVTETGILMENEVDDIEIEDADKVEADNIEIEDLDEINETQTSENSNKNTNISENSEDFLSEIEENSSEIENVEGDDK